MNEFQADDFYKKALSVVQIMNEARIEDFDPDHTDTLLNMLALNTTNFGGDWHKSDRERQVIFSNTLLDDLQKAANFDTTNKTLSEAQLQEAFRETARRLKA